MEKFLTYINPKRVIDIGAHIGTFTEKICNNFQDCEVIMFEANPHCEEQLSLIGKPYKMFPLSNKEGFSTFYFEKDNKTSTGASLYKENTPWYDEGKYDTRLVFTRTLDSCKCFNGQSIDLIKIDVQGSELDVLNGGEETIKRSDYVLIEVSLVEYNQGSPLMGEIIEKMRDYDFRIYDIVEYHSFPHLFGGAIFQMDILFKRN